MKRLSLILLLPLLGCAAKKPARMTVDLNIPVSCVESVALRDCDLSAHPPKCKSTTIHYKGHGCETVVVRGLE